MADVTLIAGVPYAASGATTFTLKPSGNGVLAPLAAGQSVTLASGAQVTSPTTQTVTVSAGALGEAPLAVTAQSGANANARRALNTTGTTTAPSTSTDGYSCSGHREAVVTLDAAGACTVNLYAYTAISGVWAIVATYAPSGAAKSHNIVDIRGFDRLALNCSANGTSAQVSGWLGLILQPN